MYFLWNKEVNRTFETKCILGVLSLNDQPLACFRVPGSYFIFFQPFVFGWVLVVAIIVLETIKTTGR